MNLYSYSILAYRALYGLSTEEFAVESGIDPDRIRMFESGTLTPDYDELTKLANMGGWSRIMVPSETGGGAVTTERKRGRKPAYYGQSTKMEVIDGSGRKNQTCGADTE